jgi:hypothetical protein
MRFRGMFLGSFDISTVPTPYGAERVRLLLKFRFRVEFFDFRFSAYLVYSVSKSGLLDFPQLLSEPHTRILYYGAHANAVLAKKL